MSRILNLLFSMKSVLLAFSLKRKVLLQLNGNLKCVMLGTVILLSTKLKLAKKLDNKLFRFW